MSASCLLHPDKRTLIIGFCTFALGQEETLMRCNNDRRKQEDRLAAISPKSDQVF
jgi:hypothetical protein